jgi:hypothetical protein
MTPQELVTVYPWLDHLMAETLLKAHENGTLKEYLKDWPDQVHVPMTSEVVVGAVTVEEKSIAGE